MSTPLKIVIAGAGAAGYFAAAAIRRNCPNTDVTVVYDPDTPHIGVGESIAWNGAHFMRDILGLTTFEWLKESGSTFKYSVGLQSFHGTDEIYHTLPPFNPPVSSLFKSVRHANFDYYPGDGSEISLYDMLLHLWAKGLIDGSNLQVYSSELFHFMDQNKSPIDSKGQWSVDAFAGHSYHINANYIKDVVHERVGRPHGVKTLARKIKDVILTENGAIDHLLLDDDQHLRADLFIDSTGFARVLARRLPYKFDPCDEYFNDTALVGPHVFADESEYSGTTLSQAMDYGWRFSISAEGRSGEGYVFNSRIFDREDQLIDEYQRKTGKRDVSFRKLKWQPGYQHDTFVKNCITIGIAHGFSDVFDANNFSATLRQIETLVYSINNYPGTEFLWRDYYNNYCRHISWDIVFRIQTAFHLARRRDTIYWQEMSRAAKKFDTEQRLIDSIFDPTRRLLPNREDNKYAYSQHLFINQAVYNQTPISRDRCLLDIDSDTESLALQFFHFFKNSYEIKARKAISIPDFYREIYSRPKAYQISKVPFYHDFLG